jgi:hypothetical protein
LICTAPIEIPPALAEPVDEPTARASYPSRIRRMTNHTMIAARIAMRNRYDRCGEAPNPKTLPRSGTRAFFGKMSVRRSTFSPSGTFVYFSGPFRAHATRLIAIPFIMIVVTTSWAPVLTFKIAGTAA